MAAKAAKKKESGFTREEKAAMRERARELKGQADGEKAIKEKIAEMPKADRVMAERVHGIVREVAPGLMPRTWYGMPAYSKDGKVVCFFQSADKFGSRYATFGFNDTAKLDQGAMWPTSFALTEIGDAEEKKIRTLVKKAVR
jgi:uncharacterized protein YdhG (YjbR/CyaY superfamily)